ncbi:DUF1127 domain-containing protein [Puniceibacterium sp. IMCC21224]|uniref:DUF1127 domain-containing protein n=1 Tax=Puniceibacterium sp. IMCC21224 TaxID=1618204 RepID=UPI00064DDF98|nr:DUF1127 domain-containing protein [Puniceibacterium sp. IMCC21224]KMK66657.1 hypothetical protein IMCC21224_111514 [Puniceibacterium sp. IMCC21224]
MAYATHITSAAQGTDVSVFSALLTKLRLQLAQRRTYNQTLRELEALSNRELADLGISRSSIRSIAQEAAYGA